MKKFLFLIPSLLSAQSLATFHAGSLFCGLVERTTNNVQVYCKDTNFLVFNSTVIVGQNTDTPGAQLRFYRAGDNFQITFNLINNIISYQVITNTESQTGTLTFPFGAAGPGCSLVKPENPNFTWTVETKACVTTWSGAWLNCCLG